MVVVGCGPSPPTCNPARHGGGGLQGAGTCHGQPKLQGGGGTGEAAGSRVSPSIGGVPPKTRPPPPNRSLTHHSAAVTPPPPRTHTWNASTMSSTRSSTNSTGIVTTEKACDKGCAGRQTDRVECVRGVFM